MVKIKVTYEGPTSREYTVDDETAKSLLAPGTRLSETRAFVDIDERRYAIMMANVLVIEEVEKQ
jgi:hypothetical protein